MNDKDLQAFDKWWEDFVKKDLGPNCKAIPDHKMEKAWQAACEYKQKEIDELIKQLKHEHDLYKKHLKVYEDENAKLRECVKFYANRFSWTESDHPTHEYYAGSIRNDDSLVEYTEADGNIFKDFCGGKLARQVLKELEDK